MADKRLYIAFAGLVTHPVLGRSVAQVRRTILDDYAQRGFRLKPDEVRVRRATPADAGWLADAGAAPEVLEALPSSS